MWAYSSQRWRLVHEFSMAAGEIVGSEDRRRLEEAIWLVEFCYAVEATLDWTEWDVRSTALSHVFDCIKAIRRGDPLPTRPQAFERALAVQSTWNGEAR